MERLTTDDIIPEMAIREMVSIDMQQLSRIYHRLRLYEITGITPDKFAVINQEYTKMAKELAELRQQNRWIPVSKRLPDVPVGIDDDECPEFNVMIRGARKAAALRYNSDGTWFDDFGEVYEVIAWRPLPEPYKE